MDTAGARATAAIAYPPARRLHLTPAHEGLARLGCRRDSLRRVGPDARLNEQSLGGPARRPHGRSGGRREVDGWNEKGIWSWRNLRRSFRRTTSCPSRKSCRGASSFASRARCRPRESRTRTEDADGGRKTEAIQAGKAYHAGDGQAGESLKRALARRARRSMLSACRGALVHSLAARPLRAPSAPSPPPRLLW
jgi:hypothetical protein